MTVIVWDGKTLAADKRTGFGAEYCTTTKILRIRGHLVGWAGATALGVMVVAWFEAGADPEKFPEKQRGTDGGSLLVICPDGTVHHYASEPLPMVIDDTYFSIGSGSGMASAALYLGHDARRAVEVASALDLNCGNGIDTLCIESADSCARNA